MTRLTIQSIIGILLVYVLGYIGLRIIGYLVFYERGYSGGYYGVWYEYDKLGNGVEQSVENRIAFGMKAREIYKPIVWLENLVRIGELDPSEKNNG